MNYWYNVKELLNTFSSAASIEYLSDAFKVGAKLFLGADLLRLWLISLQPLR